MEEEPDYIVEITPDAEIYYLQLLEYLYQTHSVTSAERKADEVLDMALSLDKNPYRGRKEEKLSFLEKDHRFLVYRYTSRKCIKIIYFVDEAAKKVFVTDFFGTEMNDKKMTGRTK
jgi:plasmid stabilization system protein ParE